MLSLSKHEGRRLPSPGRLAWHAVALGLAGFFVLLPILAFMLHSFWRLENGQTVEELTLDNYRTFFTDATYLKVYFFTVLLSAGVTVLNVALGYLIALFIVRRSKPVRFLLIVAFLVPLFMSYIIKIYAIRGILGQRGVLNEVLIDLGLIDEPLTFLLFNTAAIFLTLVIVYLPFAILPIYLALDRIPRNYFAASADLGGSTLDELRFILLPLSLPGVVAAVLFTFVLSFGDFVTPQMVGGTEGFTFGRIVFNQFGLSLNWPRGAALAVILLATSLVVVAAAGLLARRRQGAL
jgi:spermidine/putrescine transport system permease protein